MRRWAHQERGFTETVSAIDAGDRAICLTSPTGGGKSKIMLDLLEWATVRDWQSVIYSNRVMLTEQLGRDLSTAGISHGIRASGHAPDFGKMVQISQIQTEESRVYKREEWQLTKAKLVIVDEAHNQKSGMFQRVIEDHLKDGAAVVGFTATPLDIGHIYKRMIIAGTTSELWNCGALVPCHVYAPDEPDTHDLKRTKTGEFTEGDVTKAIMSPTIFARVVEHWKQLNPDGRPTILFAPGVGESIWFAEQFHAAGISAAHIDGDDIWCNGQLFKSTATGRADILAGSKDGSIKIVCNRFVLREAINMPWLFHGIGATIFGTLTSYLQSVGRLLRSDPSLSHVQWQDHGGNYWRHGSPNADREWNLDDTAKQVAERRENAMREKREPDPIVCPQCRKVRLGGPKCQACGHQHTKSSRIVVQKDGSLRSVAGDILKPRKVSEKPDTAKLWERVYWRGKNSQMTFKQAEALFFREHHYWPPRTLPLMPTSELDWARKVREVPWARLTARPKREPEPSLFGASE